MRNLFKIVLMLFVFTNSFSSNAQQKILAKFIVTDASANGVDITPEALENGQYIVFYTGDDEDVINMSNYWEKVDSQSYGPMYATKTDEIKESDETYKADIFNFKWRYINTYDSKKGTASVTLTKVYKPQGVTFIIKIIPENLDILIYKGYMEGTIDFSNY